MLHYLCSDCYKYSVLEVHVQTHTRAIGEEPRSRNMPTTAMSRSQIGLLIVLGVGFWFAAAMIIRFGAPAGFFGPTASVFAFVLSIPICWLSVAFIKHVARLAAGQTLPGIAIGLVAATLCDGIGLTWGNGLYGADPVMTTFGAAWILWGVGFFLWFAYLHDLRHGGTTR